MKKSLRQLDKRIYLQGRSWLRQERLLAPEFIGQAASDMIRAALPNEQPRLVYRFGRVELDAVLGYVERSAPGSDWRKQLNFLRGQSGGSGWAEATRSSMRNNAGFFPTDDASLERFAELMLADMPAIDIGSDHRWQHGQF